MIQSDANKVGEDVEIFIFEIDQQKYEEFIPSRSVSPNRHDAIQRITVDVEALIPIGGIILFVVVSRSYGPITI